MDALILKPTSRRILFFTFLLLRLTSQPLPPLKSTSSPIVHFPLLPKCLSFTSFVTQRDISFPKAPWEERNIAPVRLNLIRITLRKNNNAPPLRLSNLITWWKNKPRVFSIICRLIRIFNIPPGQPTSIWLSSVILTLPGWGGKIKLAEYTSFRYKCEGFYRLRRKSKHRRMIHSSKKIKRRHQNLVRTFAKFYIIRWSQRIVLKNCAWVRHLNTTFCRNGGGGNLN